MTILLVEDHIATLRAMEMLLKSNGYTVLAAATAEEALKIAEHQPCDVLVSDIMLPGQSGIDLMREMKTRYGTRGIAVTGSVIFDDPQDALDVGFSRCIKKPVVFTALMKAVEEILQQTPASAPFVS